VLVHGFAPTALGGLRTYAELAAEHPRVPVIVGAFGGLSWPPLVDLAARRANLFPDTSGVLLVFGLRAAVRAPPEQCLFGPNTPYGDVLASGATLEAAVEDPTVRDLVLGGNLGRVLGERARRERRRPGRPVMGRRIPGRLVRG